MTWTVGLEDTQPLELMDWKTETASDIWIGPETNHEIVISFNNNETWFTQTPSDELLLT